MRASAVHMPPLSNKIGDRGFPCRFGSRAFVHVAAGPYNAVMRPTRHRRVVPLALVAIGLILLVLAFRNSGNFLVVDNREKSDAIVTTQGDSLDAAYWLGIHLLSEGYGRELLIDARQNQIFFGRNQAEWARDFIQKTASGVSGQAKVCPITAGTTAGEVYEVGNCLKGRSIHSVLLVVGDFSQPAFPGHIFTVAAAVPLVDRSAAECRRLRRGVVAEAGMGADSGCRVAAPVVVGDAGPVAL